MIQLSSANGYIEFREIVFSQFRNANLGKMSSRVVDAERTRALSGLVKTKGVKMYQEFPDIV